MIKVNVSGNFRRLAVKIENIKNQTRASLKRSLIESGKLVQDNVKVVMRESKNGVLKPKRLQRIGSPIRRSARGEGLARDTGYAEKLLKTKLISSSVAEVGFKVNPSGFDYVKYWENKGRPTLGTAAEYSMHDIRKIFQKNLKPIK